MSFFSTISESALVIGSIVLSVAATAFDALATPFTTSTPEPTKAPDSLAFDYFYASKECQLLVSSIKRAARGVTLDFNKLEEVSLIDNCISSKTTYFQGLYLHAFRRILLYDQSTESFALCTKLAVHSKFSDFFAPVCLEKFKNHAKLFEKDDAPVKWDFVKVFAYFVSTHPKTPSKTAAEFASFVFATSFLNSHDPRLRESVRSTAQFRVKGDYWISEPPPLFSTKSAQKSVPDLTYKDDEFQPGTTFFVTSDHKIRRTPRAVPSRLRMC